jgi:hypothetical protein
MGGMFDLSKRASGWRIWLLLRVNVFPDLDRFVSPRECFNMFVTPVGVAKFGRQVIDSDVCLPWTSKPAAVPSHRVICRLVLGSRFKVALIKATNKGDMFRPQLRGQIWACKA